MSRVRCTTPSHAPKMLLHGLSPRIEGKRREHSSTGEGSATQCHIPMPQFRSRSSKSIVPGGIWAEWLSQVASVGADN